MYFATLTAEHIPAVRR